MIGELMILGEDPEKGAALIAKAIEDGGTETFYKKSLGWALWRTKRRDDAVKE